MKSLLKAKLWVAVAIDTFERLWYELADSKCDGEFKENDSIKLLNKSMVREPTGFLLVVTGFNGWRSDVEYALEWYWNRSWDILTVLPEFV